MEPDLLEFDLGRGVRAFSTGRRGGYSIGAYASFNANAYCGDDAYAVRMNRELFCRAMGLEPARLVMPHQVHGVEVRRVDEAFFRLPEEGRKSVLEGVDAVMTDLPCVCVSVSTADCIPILIYDVRHHAVAAVHAGWRGTVLRIAELTLQRMVDEFGCDPRQVWATIGPSISPSAFEVGEEVVDAFHDAGFDLSRLLLRDPDSGKGHIDLWEANRMSLTGAGLDGDHIELAGICTYERFSDYFSARRLGIQSGRFLSGIYINEAVLP